MFILKVVVTEFDETEIGSLMIISRYLIYITSNIRKQYKLLEEK